MEEIWKDIPGYENFYQASNLGKIRSKDRYIYLPQNKSEILKKGRILKTNKVAFDYLQVTLYKDKKRRSLYVSNLVMLTFVGPKPKGYEVNHKNENKNDNSLENLEYITSKENNNYGTRKSRMISKNTNGKKSQPVKATSLKTGEVFYFPSQAEAERKGYGNQRHISSVCLGKRKQCNGYKWEFI